MPDLHTSNDANNNANNNGNKQGDDLVDMGNATGGDDRMDLDFDLGMAEGEENTFNDLFFGDVDDDGLSGGAEMQHGKFDNAFFGLDD
jgi:hypothetical protein